MKSNSKEVELKIPLAGFEKKDIKVKLTDKGLAVSAERKIQKKVQRKDFFHAESSSHVFAYQTTLPKVNPKKAKIQFSKGTLTIKVPKKR
jgi:HSP20 family protein